MKFFIYALEANGAIIYVGVTTQPDRRMQVHRWRGHKHVQCIILEETLEETYQRTEQKWIAYYRSVSAPLLNRTSGGQRMRLGPRAPHTLETKQKISLANTGRTRIVPPEVGAKISAAKKGVPFTAEHCAAISLAQKGKPKPPFTALHKENIRLAALRRKPRAQETLINVIVVESK